MGGKKKGKSGGKGKKGGEEEDLSTENLQRFYRKKCTEHGVRPARQMNAYFEQYYEEGDHIKKLHLHEELNPKGAQALMEALSAARYVLKHGKIPKLAINM